MNKDHPRPDLTMMERLYIFYDLSVCVWELIMRQHHLLQQKIPMGDNKINGTSIILN